MFNFKPNFESKSVVRIEIVHSVFIIHASFKEVCGNATINRSTVQWWHKRFREGMNEHRKQPMVWWSLYSNQQHKHCFCHILHENWCATLGKIKAETGIPWTVVHFILTEHLFKKNVAVW